jgi:isoprenylcysteine carboxyl methyltransferase (ICMT) family protein YpbQ
MPATGRWDLTQRLMGSNVLHLFFLMAMGEIEFGAQNLNSLFLRHIYFLLLYIFTAFHNNQRNVQYHQFYNSSKKIKTCTMLSSGSSLM